MYRSPYISSFSVIGYAVKQPQLEMIRAYLSSEPLASVLWGQFETVGGDVFRVSSKWPKCSRVPDSLVKSASGHYARAIYSSIASWKQFCSLTLVPRYLHLNILIGSHKTIAKKIPTYGSEKSSKIKFKTVYISMASPLAESQSTAIEAHYSHVENPEEF